MAQTHLRPPSLHFDPPSSPSSPSSPDDATLSVSGFIETPLNDSMPDFSMLQSTSATTTADDDPASPASGGVKELLTVPGREGDETAPNPFFSRRPSFRGGSREGTKFNRKLFCLVPPLLRDVMHVLFCGRVSTLNRLLSFFRKSKSQGSPSADSGIGGDKSSSPFPPSSSSAAPPLSSPSPPPPPRKTNTVVEFKLVEDFRLVTIPVSACILFLTFYIILGTMLFSMWEGWSYLDGAYFCFTSLMTIGFGDFVPGKEYIYREDASMEDVETRAKLVMGNVYILLGMSIVSMSLNLMWEKIVQNIRTAMRRIGLMRPARYDDA